MKIGAIRPGTTKSIFLNSMLVLASLGLALVLAEVRLRVLGVSLPVFGRADPLTGWAHLPGAEGWYTGEGRSYVRINSDGWRGKERPFRKPAGVTRIAILGDSYTEALQVPEDSAFPSLLERNLNSTLPGQYEVLNFGVSGYGTGQELLVLRHHALAYAPDAVILAFTTGNDVSDNSRALKQVDHVPYFRLVDQRREGFGVLALAPLLASQAIATHAYYHGFGKNQGRGHWNERGHRAAATLMTSWLADRLRRDLRNWR